MSLPKLKPWQTAALVILIGLGAIAFLLLGWGVVEALTLADDVEGNHITAVFRELWAKEPGAILIALLIISNGLVGALGYLGGHLFWCSAPDDLVEELGHQEYTQLARWRPARGGVEWWCERCNTWYVTMTDPRQHEGHGAERGAEHPSS